MFVYVGRSTPSKFITLVCGRENISLSKEDCLLEECNTENNLSLVEYQFAAYFLIFFFSFAEAAATGSALPIIPPIPGAPSNGPIT
jgi:hypothetical protein